MKTESEEEELTASTFLAKAARSSMCQPILDVSWVAGSKLLVSGAF
jgi:hypothetical protein